MALEHQQPNCAQICGAVNGSEVAGDFETIPSWLLAFCQLNIL